MERYSVKWCEESNSERIVMKQKNFQTDQQRDKFITALTTKENFREIVGWSGQPKEERHEASQQRR